MSSGSERVLARFHEISAVPRCSEKERAISDWIASWAEEQGFSVERDEVLNVLVRVPGTGRAASADPVVLQGHLDMVCEKTPESGHDFARDPISMVEDGEWLRAEGTTLGADNGIAVAFALAVAEDPRVQHPPLELLFTVDEESGLTGAQKLKPGWFAGTTLLNLDSEDEGVLTVGCAGGRTTRIAVPVTRTAPSGDLVFVTLTVGGLQGGHSGVDIHHNRANANVLAVRVLQALVERAGAVPADFSGGNAHNAIPRDCAALLGLPAANRDAARGIAAQWQEILATEYRATDPNLFVRLEPAAAPAGVLDGPSRSRVINTLLGLPHGVIRMSDQVPGLVETSTNLATVRINGGELDITTSQRSSSETQLAAIGGRVEAIARLAGGTVQVTSEYSPWEPDVESEVVQRARSVYEELFGTEPVIEMIHAGLECGVIGAKYPGLQMISMGPTIQLPHSPDERLHLPSVQRVWDFLTGLLASY